MKKSKGFTLIELVIVIVILGILGAVAAPKFLNLQGDAYGANLSTVKASMESASSIANAKAIIKGVDKTDTGATLTAAETGTNAITLAYGYPTATAAGIIAALNIKAAESAAADKTAAEYIYTADENKTITLRPKSRETETTCQVTYKEADNNTAPVIEILKSGC